MKDPVSDTRCKDGETRVRERGRDRALSYKQFVCSLEEDLVDVLYSFC